MENLFDLTGKVAIVTGSTKGIGKSIAEQMANHGAKVVVSSRKADVCEAVTNEINEQVKDGAGSAISIPCNIGSKEQLQMLVDETRWGGISHLNPVQYWIKGTTSDVGG